MGLKARVAQFLLGRGINYAEELVSKTVRGGAVSVGTSMVTHGLIMGDQVQVLAGAAVILVGAAASYARTFLGKYADGTSENKPTPT